MPQESKLSQKVCIFGEEAYFPTSTKLNKGDSPLLLCFDKNRLKVEVFNVFLPYVKNEKGN